jgi:tetratricopeptide (TPR) repeat protein
MSRQGQPALRDPTVRAGRWGRLVLAGLVAAAVLGALSGCATRGPAEDCLPPDRLVYSAESDSLDLESFLALEPAERDLRRRQARYWLDRGRRAARAADRIQGFRNAAGLTPDDPEIWLRLAHIWRWVGEDLRTRDCLDSAAAAIRALGRAESDFPRRSNRDRDEMALRTALLRAWFHYDRAEWREGLDWARAAVDLQPGNAAALQIRGLLEGRLNYKARAMETAADMRRIDDYDIYYDWIRGNLEWAQGRPKEAYDYALTMNPVRPQNAAEAWRAMAEAAERVGDWSRAMKWYKESYAHLPFDDTSCLTAVTHARLSPGPRSSHQPFWVAFGRYYVTGSRSAYTQFALERFQAATDPVERDHWAGAVVNHAGIILRAGDEKVGARRARGLVFARTGKEQRALTDLQRVARELEEPDPVVEAEIGHVLLLLEDHKRALPHLRRATSQRQDMASALGDLGLALIMEGERDEAAKALTRALELDPTLVRAWYNRGLMNLHDGDLAAAEADLAKAAELAPDNLEIGRLLQQVRLRRAAE